MTLVLRTAEDLDCAEIGALHYRSRAAAYAGLVSAEALTFGSPAALGEWWTERWRWEKTTHRLTVARDGERLAGFTYAGPTEEDGVTELYAIHVDPADVGTGIGRTLMLDVLPHLGPRSTLWVLEDNARARRFYERGGWIADGTVRDAPMGGVTTRQLRYSRS